MSTIVTASGLRIVGLKTASTQWFDSFKRPNGPLGGDWIDGHDWDSDIYEPLGIFDESVVCTNPRARGGTYQADQTVHPITIPGELYQGIGCAWRDFETDVINVSYRYSGIWDTPTHTEGGPLLHVVPGTPEHGFGAWLTTVSDIPFLVVGALCNPPEDWPQEGTGDFQVVAHTDGVPRTIELRSDGVGITAWLDGNQVSFNTHGLDPIDVPANLLGSTLHGFCVDTHLVDELDIPTTPVIHSVSTTPGTPAPAGLVAELLASGDKGWDEMPHHTTLVTSSVSPGTNCALVLLATGTVYSPSSPTSQGLFADHGFYPLTIVSSGSGPTWTQQAYGNGLVGYSDSGSVFTAIVGGSDPGSFTVTIDFCGTGWALEAGGYAWALYKITGFDTGTPFAGAVGTYAQAGNGPVTATLAATPTADDITLALSGANVSATGASPGATFGSTYGTWTQDATSSGSKWYAWVAGQRTGSTDDEVEFSDVNAQTSNNYGSGQAAIIVKAP